MTNPTLLTPSEFDRIKTLNWPQDSWMPALIATLEAAWAENEKLRDFYKRVHDWWTEEQGVPVEYHKIFAKNLEDILA